MFEKEEVREWVTIQVGEMKLFGVIHRPLQGKRSPAVLVCHGFGGSKTGRFRIYVELASLLAKAGIVTLRLDFRGCGDSEGNFSDTTVNSEVEDALKGLEFLSRILKLTLQE